MHKPRHPKAHDTISCIMGFCLSQAGVVSVVFLTCGVRCVFKVWCPILSSVMLYAFLLWNDIRDEMSSIYG